MLWMCLIGLVAGALSKLITSGRDPGAIIVTMVLGIAGSLLAGFLGRSGYQEGRGAGLICPSMGSILLPPRYRLFRRGPSAREVKPELAARFERLCGECSGTPSVLGVFDSDTSKRYSGNHSQPDRYPLSVFRWLTRQRFSSRPESLTKRKEPG